MMEKKTSIKRVTKVKETKQAIIFKANRPLMKEEFDLLSDVVKREEEKIGLKIVLMPFSCEVE